MENLEFGDGIITRVEKENFICFVCTETFSGPEECSQHTKKHIHQEPACCDICVKGFFCVSALNEHQINHEMYGSKNGDSKFVVINSHCNTYNRDGNSYKNSDTETASFPCPKCRKSFDTQEGLDYHLATHPEKTIQCVLCEQNFLSDYYLKRHIRKEHRGDHPFHCIYCWQDQPSMSALKSHLNSHRDEINLLCAICKQKFPYRSDYNRHMASHFKPTRDNLQCDVCDKILKNEDKLQKHKLLHVGLDPFCCLTCKKVYANKEELKLHIAQEHNKVPTCNICHKHYRFQADLKRHMQVHKSKDAEELETSCSICLKDFGTLYGLNRHMLTHRQGQGTKQNSSCNYKPTSYPCPDCEYSFPTEKELKEHSEDHLVYCKACPKKFKSQSRLTLHMKAMHEGLSDSNGKNIICDICGTPCFTKIGLAEHMHRHKGTYECPYCDYITPSKTEFGYHKGNHIENGHMCDICAKIFPSHSGLMIHRVSHSDNRPFTCDICTKSFKRLAILQSHMLIHQSDRPHQCPECSNTFSTTERLKTHIEVTHTQEKRHKCEVCQKAFSTKQYLIQHERTHDKVRAYSCAICYKTFNTPQGLYQHKRTHQGRPLVCKGCGKRFNFVHSLRQHIAVACPGVDRVDPLSPPQNNVEVTDDVEGDNTKQYKCHVCNKIYSTPQGVYQHRKYHHKNYKFSCEYCGFEFGKVRDWKTHERFCKNKPLANTLECSSKDKKGENEVNSSDSHESHGKEKTVVAEIVNHSSREDMHNFFQSITHLDTSSEDQTKGDWIIQNASSLGDDEFTPEVMNRIQELLSNECDQVDNILDVSNGSTNINTDRKSNLLGHSTIYLDEGNVDGGNDDTGIFPNNIAPNLKYALDATCVEMENDSESLLHDAIFDETSSTDILNSII